MFGLNEALMSFIRRQVGLRTDSADPAGSLHAKVTEGRNTIYNYLTSVINNRIYAWGTKTPIPVSGSGSSGPGSETTLISVTGSGWFMGCSFKCTDAGNSGYAVPRVYINGSLIWEGNGMVVGSFVDCAIFARYTNGLRMANYGSGGYGNDLNCKGIILPD